jgi:molecular chaperone GrpE
MFNKTSRSNKQETEATHTEPGSDPEMTTDEQAVGVEAMDGMAPAGELETLLAEAEEWKGKYQLLQDQYARLAADFDNYRKRMREEQESLVRYGAQKSVMELLPVLDNLERATASLSEKSDPAVLYKSFGVVLKQLMDGLDAMGIKKIQAIGQPFDPQYHEAVNRMPSTEFAENTNMYEAQSGYQLHDKVIRPALVVVSTGPAEEAIDSDASASPAQETGAQKETAENRSNPFLR